MAILEAFYQPATVAEAVALLARTDCKLLPLAGGSSLIGQLESRTLTGVDGVVDLSRLQLDRITQADGMLHIGATATLTAIAAHEVAGKLANGLLCAAAKGEGGANLRNAATIGGVIAAAEPDSEFYAALLALGALVQTTGVQTADGSQEQVRPLAQLPAAPGLITGVQIPLDATRGCIARVARTPADRPIVAAVAVRRPSGDAVALCGVAPRPVLQGSRLAIPDDFRGSAAYREAMMHIMVQRALTCLG